MAFHGRYPATVHARSPQLEESLLVLSTGHFPRAPELSLLRPDAAGFFSAAITRLFKAGQDEDKLPKQLQPRAKDMLIILFE